MYDRVINAITEHAKREYPKESCGLLVRQQYRIQYIECKNVSSTPEHTFLLDPINYVRYYKDTIMIVHSHPDYPPEPSDADKASCEQTKLPFLILSYPSCDIQCYYPTGWIAPLEDRQFVYGVFDCFALVRDWYARQLQIDLPDRERPFYGWWLDKNNEFILKDYETWGFRRVDSPQRGDVIVMQLQAVIPNHVAVYLGDGLMMHHTLNNISKTEVFGHYWRKNTVCYLRHEKNNPAR